LKIGIIGGSGLDDPKFLKDPDILDFDTEYGQPSSLLLSGKINDIETVILSRHGTKHQYSPTQVNNRANIKALQKAGVTHIIATTACGSLRADIDRGHLVILDQFIDFTKHRKISFHDSFESGTVHTPMAKPFDPLLRKALYEKSKELGYKTHEKGTVITIEGPRFSTIAESKMFKSWGADVINMSIATEAILANEMGIPFGAVAMSTDYDCWKEDEKPVSWDEIIEVFTQNVDNVINLLKNVVPRIDELVEKQM